MAEDREFWKRASEYLPLYRSDMPVVRFNLTSLSVIVLTLVP